MKLTLRKEWLALEIESKEYRTIAVALQKCLSSTNVGYKR